MLTESRVFPDNQLTWIALQLHVPVMWCDENETMKKKFKLVLKILNHNIYVHHVPVDDRRWYFSCRSRNY